MVLLQTVIEPFSEIEKKIAVAALWTDWINIGSTGLLGVLIDITNY